MNAARKLTAEQRAACVWSRPKLRLVRVTPVEPERPAVSRRFESIAIAVGLFIAVAVDVACAMGWV